MTRAHSSGRSEGRWILLITLAEQAIVTAVRPLVTYRALALEADPFDLGIIAGLFATVSLASALLVGRWVDRGNERTSAMVGASVMAIACLAVIAADSLLILAVSQAALGLGQTLLTVGCQALLVHRGTTGGQRDSGFGFYMAAASLGQLIGPAVAGFIVYRVASSFADAAEGQELGTVWVLTGAVVASAAIGGMTARLGARSGSAGMDERQLGGLSAIRAVLAVRNMPLAITSSMLLTSSIDLLITYLPAYGLERGWSVETVGLLLSARALASLVARLLTTQLVAALGRRRILAASMLLPAVALAMLALLQSLPTAFLLLSIVGFWLGIGVPITLHWVSLMAPSRSTATAVGVRLAGNRLGQIALPVVGGALGSAAGLGAIFPALAATLSVAAVTLFRSETPVDPRGSGEPFLRP